MYHIYTVMYVCVRTQNTDRIYEPVYLKLSRLMQAHSRMNSVIFGGGGIPLCSIDPQMRVNVLPKSVFAFILEFFPEKKFIFKQYTKSYFSYKTFHSLLSVGTPFTQKFSPRNTKDVTESVHAVQGHNASNQKKKPAYSVVHYLSNALQFPNL